MLTSLFTILIAFIPVLIYIGIIYLTTPWKSISIKKASRYLFTGLLSAGIVLTFQRLFPGFYEPYDLGFTILHPAFDTIFLMCLIQVALIEEVAKYITFRMGESSRNTDNDHPVATMFYFGINSLGFAFIENIMYAFNYGDDVLIIRSIASMMLHLLTGLYVGYWISLGRINKKLDNRSAFEVLMAKRPKLRRTIYTGIGLLAAIFIHTLFNFNAYLFTPSTYPIMFIILGAGLLFAYTSYKDLLNKHRRLLKEKEKQSG